MAVDDVRDGLIRHLSDAFQNVLGVRGRRIDYNHSPVINHEHGLITVVCDHVESLAKVLDAVSFSRINRGALGGFRNVEMPSNADAEWGYRRHVWIRIAGCSGRVLVYSSKS